MPIETWNNRSSKRSFNWWLGEYTRRCSWCFKCILGVQSYRTSVSTFGCLAIILAPRKINMEMVKHQFEDASPTEMVIFHCRVNYLRSPLRSLWFASKQQCIVPFYRLPSILLRLSSSARILYMGFGSTPVLGIWEQRCQKCDSRWHVLFLHNKKPTPQKNEMITSNLPDPWRWSEPPLSGRSLKAVPTHTILQTTSDKNDSGFWSLLMCVMNFQQHLGSRSDVNESNIQKCTDIQI